MNRQTSPNTVRLHQHTIFIIVTFLYWFSLYIYVPILSPYLETIESSYTIIGIVLGSYGIMQILLRLPLGIFSDFLKMRRPFIILGMTTASLSCFGFAITNSIEWALIFRIIAGVTAASWVAFTVLYSSYFDKHETTRAMGNIQFITVFAQLIGMGLSGYIVYTLGWKAPFIAGGIAGLIGLVLCCWILETDTGPTSKKFTVNETLSIIKEPLLIKVSFLSMGAHSILFITMFGFTPTHAVSIGANTTDLSFLVFAFMIPHALAPILTGKIFVKKLGEMNILMIGFLGTSIFTFTIPYTQTLYGLYITQIFNGFSQGMIFPILLSMAIKKVKDDKRATAMGTYQSLYAFGILLGPLLAGTLNSTWGLKAGFYLASCIGLISSLLIAFWSKYSSKIPYHSRQKDVEVQ